MRFKFLIAVILLFYSTDVNASLFGKRMDKCVIDLKTLFQRHFGGKKEATKKAENVAESNPSLIRDGEAVDPKLEATKKRLAETLQESRRPLIIDSTEEIIQSKYVMRELLDGGPVQVAGEYVSVIPKESTITRGQRVFDEDVSKNQNRLIEKYGEEQASHYSFGNFNIHKDQNQNFIPKNRTELGQYLEKLANAPEGTSVVYKLTKSGSGVGVFHLEKTKDGIRLVLPLMELPGGGNPNVYEGLISTDAIHFPLERDVEKMIATATITKEDLSKLEYFLESAQISSYGEYISAMFERQMPLFKVDGNAYDTRQKVEIDLATGKINLHPEDKGAYWLGRVGSSEYYSNYTFRERKGKKFSEEEMFDPLFEAYDIKGERRAEFRRYVDDLLAKQISFMRVKLLEMGVDPNGTYYGGIDFGWMPPKNQGEFPIPVIVETDMSIRRR